MPFPYKFKPNLKIPYSFIKFIVNNFLAPNTNLETEDKKLSCTFFYIKFDSQYILLLTRINILRAYEQSIAVI